MIKYILAGTAATVIAVTVGVIVLKKDLACEYSPINLSGIIDCDSAQTHAAANTETATEEAPQNDDVSPVAGSQEIEQRTADEPAEAEVAEVADVVAEKIVPTFDIVRVEPDGSTLVAGRSAPNARIILRDGDKNIGETTASDAGEWVIIVDEPIQAATATLSLLAMLPDGTFIESTAMVNIAMYKETPASPTVDVITEQKPVIKLVDAAGEKADEMIAKTEDTAKQAVAEAADSTSKAVEKTVEQAEQLAKEAAALLKKAANRTAQAAKVETAPIIEEVEPAPLVNKVAEEAEATPTIEKIEPAPLVNEVVEEAEATPTIEKVEPAPLVNKVAEGAEATPTIEKIEPAPLVNEVVEEAIKKITETAETAEKAASTVSKTMEPVVEIAAKEMDKVSLDAKEPVTEVAAKPTATKPVTNEPVAKITTEETPQIVAETAKTEPAQQDKTPLVVISEKGKATKILQGAGIGSQNNEMTFNSMDYNEKGEIIFSGDAKPNEMVRVYINNEFIGETRADASGRWSLDEGYVMQAGPNSLRFDQVDAAGKVISRRETNITMPKLAQVVTMSEPKTETASEPKIETAPKAEKPITETPKAADTVKEAATAAKAAEPMVKEAVAKTQATASQQVVEKAQEATLPIAEIIEVKGGRAIIIWGDNLWNISRKIYGKGELYTTIFKANKDQIRNPDLIYPGQVFLLPEAVDIQ